MKITPIAAILAIALCGAAQAQDNAVDVVQRDANLQQRIERGLASGQLSTQEAGRLERLLQRVERNQADALPKIRAELDAILNSQPAAQPINGKPRRN